MIDEKRYLEEAIGTGAVVAAVQAATTVPTNLVNPLKRVSMLAPDDEGYPGLRMKAWINPPASVREKLQSDKTEELRDALKTVMLEHVFEYNGRSVPWPSPYDGTPLPPPSSDDFWEAIPDELFMAVCYAFQEEVKKGIDRLNKAYEHLGPTSSRPTPEESSSQTSTGKELSRNGGESQDPG